MTETIQGVDQYNNIKAALFGIAVGDALGVPVEFLDRETIAKRPVTDMIGYGTHHQPAGTWSDDSSLTFCLAEALTQEFDLQAIAQLLVKWFKEDYWTPYGHVFDIGMSTEQAIRKLASGIKPELAGGITESDNGNGSLMRILPLLFYLKDKPINERFDLINKVSSITHRHIRSIIACFYYLEFARQIIKKRDKHTIYRNLQTEVLKHLEDSGILSSEIALFNRLLRDDIQNLSEQQIHSSGYVLHTLEASIWCLMTTNSYEEAVLRAVNLGLDTDTTGAVTGGLAGLLYGFDSIPPKWLKQLARKANIEDLAERLAQRHQPEHL